MSAFSSSFYELQFDFLYYFQFSFQTLTTFFFVCLKILCFLCVVKKNRNQKNGVSQSCFEKNRKRKKIEVAEVTKRGLHLTLEIRKNISGFEN